MSSHLPCYLLPVTVASLMRPLMPPLASCRCFVGVGQPICHPLLSFSLSFFFLSLTYTHTYTHILQPLSRAARANCRAVLLQDFSPLLAASKLRKTRKKIDSKAQERLPETEDQLIKKVQCLSAMRMRGYPRTCRTLPQSPRPFALRQCKAQ